jgi:hypothetical protein
MSVSSHLVVTSIPIIVYDSKCKYILKDIYDHRSGREVAFHKTLHRLKERILKNKNHMQRTRIILNKESSFDANFRQMLFIASTLINLKKIIQPQIYLVPIGTREMGLANMLRRYSKLVGLEVEIYTSLQEAIESVFHEIHFNEL